ncbi:MAG: MarR family winged helix-turn-helix transcriptional regulator [Betaproteobacteria bacterium]
MTAAPATPDPRQHAYARFVVAHALITERIETALAAADLPSLDWYDVLWVLENAPEGRLRMAGIARRAVFSRSNVTRLADRLEKAGLVTRADCPQDGRGTMCVITARGRALRARMWAVYRGQIDQLFGAHLSVREAGMLAESLQRMISSLRQNEKETA